MASGGCGRIQRAGIALIELVAVAVLLAAVLLLLARVVEHARTKAKRELAVRVLASLDAALQAYREAHGVWPPGRSDGDASACLAVLCADPATEPARRRLPKSWRQACEQAGVCADPWGTPLRYVTEARDPARVLANGGRPFFECAGPDRDFGDADLARRLDNILTNEPM